MSNRILREISRMIGMQNAIVLVRRYGGRTLSVPSISNLTDRHPLVFHVGLASAQSLSREYGGLNLNLPSEVNALLDERNTEIVRRFLGDPAAGVEGESVRMLSIDFGLDRKQIQCIIDKLGYREERLSRARVDA